MEFSEDGRFNLESYNEGHSFLVQGMPTRSQNDNLDWNTPMSPSVSTSSTPNRDSSGSANRSQSTTPIATLQIMRADLNTNGKPTNATVYNETAHIKLYTEDQMNVSFVENKVRILMKDNNLKIVGSNGFIIPDQEGTRGEYIFIPRHRYFVFVSNQSNL